MGQKLRYMSPEYKRAKTLQAIEQARRTEEEERRAPTIRLRKGKGRREGTAFDSLERRNGF